MTTHTATVLDELEGLADRALVEIVTLETERDELDSKIKRLRAFQRTIRPPEPKAANGNGGRRRRHTAPERLSEVAHYITDTYTLSDTFTAQDVYDGMGKPFTGNLIFGIFNGLRDIEFLAKVGKDSKTKRNMWTILDPDAIDRIAN